MNAADFDMIDVADDAPPISDDQEWEIPHGRPDDRMLVQRIPDDAPPLIREGLARRRVKAIDGVCPCGGRLLWADERVPSVGRKTLHRVVAQHWDDCPAGDAVFVPAMLAWHADA